MKVLEKLKSLDFFSTPFELRVYKNHHLTSYLGLFLTCIIGGTGLILSIILSQEIFNKNKPRVNLNEVYVDNPANYSLASNQFMFSFNFDSK